MTERIALGISLALFCLASLLADTHANLSSGQAKKVLAEMILFDKAFIPALVKSGEGKPEDLAPAMGKVNQSWKRLYARAAGLFPDDPGWKDGFKEGGVLLQDARKYAEAGNMKECHQALEDAGDALKKLRATYGLKYYLDYVTDFKKPVEAIEVVVRAKRPSELSDTDIQTLRASLVTDAINKLRVLRGAQEDATIFNLPPELAEETRVVISSEEQSLNGLKQAADNEDREGVLKLGVSIHLQSRRLLELYSE